MKCQLCSNPASVHLTKIVNKNKTEMHLCQRCAEQQQLPNLGELSLSAILSSLIGAHVGPETEALAQLTCPTCGIKYMEFRAAGRLGCPGDYGHFRDGLAPILERVHRAVRHIGKVPRRRAESREPRSDKLLTLRQQLRKAIEREAYEEAARLRDLIHGKERRNEPGSDDSEHG